jgi:excinuclease ABC subunit C
LIEAELIRLHQPEFNSLLKDDKTPLYIQITKDDYSRVLTIRKKDLDHKHLTGIILGPFPSSSKVVEVLKIARKIFPWCNQAGEQNSNSSKERRACFYYHLKQCPGACVGEISPQDYQQLISSLVTFLQGKKKTVLKQLRQQLKNAATQENFEAAALIRDRIKLIVEVTQQKYQLKPTLVLPSLTNDSHLETLLHFQKILSTYLKLPKSFPLTRIEGYDVSNTSGKLASVSMATFINGQPSSEHYRIFNIKTLDTPNDYQMLQEALLRRQNHPEWDKPNLVVIDGGKGQLRSALRSWQWPGIVISVAKKPDRIIIPTKIERQPKLAIEYQIVPLPSTHPVLRLVAHIRDESHRFSRNQHARRRMKNMFK